MSYNIFNPEVCFVEELKASWATNIQTDGSPNKVPVVSRGREVFLSVDQEESAGWAAAVVPLTKNWEPLDIDGFVDLNFNFYSEDAYEFRVSLVDSEEEESTAISINKMGFPVGEYNQVILPVAKFTKNASSFSPPKARLLKFVLTQNSKLLLSRIFLD